MTPAVIQLEGISLDRGHGAILSGITLEIHRGGRLAILGPSGSGKTSLLRIILGLIAPTDGTLRLDGEVASAAGKILKPPEERNLAVVFQDLALWPHLTVRGNLEFGLKARSVGAPERSRRIVAMLERVGLQGKEKRFPGELSGGERQRVAIARALVLEPRAVLLDEPLANLDIALKRDLLGLFKELLSERRLAAVYVTHDLREAMHLGDRLAILEQGRLAQAGTIAELQKNPNTPFVKAIFDELKNFEKPQE